MSNLQVNSECRNACKEGTHKSDRDILPLGDLADSSRDLQLDQNALSQWMTEDEQLWVHDGISRACRVIHFPHSWKQMQTSCTLHIKFVQGLF